MKLSRNALKNLSKRYKAILKKCCLLNGLGMLLVAGSCVLGVDGLVFAEQSNDNIIVHDNTTFNNTFEVHGGKGGSLFYYSDVNSNNNSLALQNCTGTIGSIFGGYSYHYTDTNLTKSSRNNVKISGCGIIITGTTLATPFDSTKNIRTAVIGGYGEIEANNNTVEIDNGIFSGIVVGGYSSIRRNEASDNTVIITGGTFTGDTINSKETITIIGGYGNSATLKNNTVNISGNADITGNIYAIYNQSGVNQDATEVSGTVDITGRPILSQANLCGYNGSTPLFGMDNKTNIKANIYNFSGDIKGIAQFTLVDIKNSHLKVADVDCSVQTGTQKQQDSEFTAENSDITINNSIYNFKDLKIQNKLEHTVDINKIRGTNSSTADIQSGTVILKDITLLSNGKFSINNESSSNQFTTQITGNISTPENSSIDAGFNTQKSFLTGITSKYNGIIKLNFGKDASWNMTGSSSVSDLTLNAGIIDIRYGRPTPAASGFRTLEIDTLDGTGGLFKVDTSLANGNTDQIIITQGSGTHQIEVRPTGTEPGVANTSFIVRQQNGTASFSLANSNGKVEQGIYFYELADRASGTAGGKEWYLRRSGGGNAEKSPTGETVLGLSGMASAYAIYMGQLSDLRERLGEIRYGTGTDGLWVRGFTQESRLSGLDGIDFSQNFYGTSFGYDRLLEQDEKNSWLLGLRGQITRADQRIDGLHDGSGDSRSYGIAAYATWQHRNGWYADTVASWDWYDQNLKTRMMDGTPVHGSYNTYGGGISQEAGRTFRFDNGFFVEPQLQLSWYWMKGRDFTTSNGMDVDQDDMYALTGRAGLVIGKKWDLGEDRFFQPYLKAGVNHVFLGDQKVLVNGIEFSDDLRGTRGYYGAGIDLQFARNARFYAEFEREDGKKASTPWSVSAGLRVEF